MWTAFDTISAVRKTPLEELIERYLCMAPSMTASHFAITMTIALLLHTKEGRMALAQEFAPSRIVRKSS
jgi:hypothetical protein